MATDTDYLTQAKQALEPNTFGEYAPSQRVTALAVISIAESLSKLIDGQGIALMGAQITPVDPGAPIDTRTDEQKAEQDATARAFLAAAIGDIVELRLQEVRRFCTVQIRLAEGAMTARAWACQSVLNILDGNIDDQLQQEAQRDA